jgi:hypothetical protein
VIAVRGIMGEITWYYPDSVDEAVSLISNEGVIAHGGGTSILRGSMKKFLGFQSIILPLPGRYWRRIKEERLK